MTLLLSPARPAGCKGIRSRSPPCQNPAVPADSTLPAATPEAIAAHESVSRDFAGAGLLVLTSPDRLHADWLASLRERGRTTGSVAREASPVERLLAPLSRDARIVTVMDGHPLALSWLGSVRGQRVVPLGIEAFGQSGDIPDLYRAYRLDAAAIIDAVARAV